MNMFGCDVRFLSCVSGYRQVPTVDVSDRKHPLSVIRQSTYREVHYGPDRLAGFDTSSPFLCGLLDAIKRDPELQSSHSQICTAVLGRYFKEFVCGKSVELNNIFIPTAGFLADGCIAELGDYMSKGADILKFFRSEGQFTNSIGMVLIFRRDDEFAFLKLGKDRFVMLKCWNDVMTLSGWLGLDDQFSVQHRCTPAQRKNAVKRQQSYGAGKELSFKKLSDALFVDFSESNSSAYSFLHGLGKTPEELRKKEIGSFTAELLWCDAGLEL